MPKFHKTEQELDTLFDKWMFVLKNLARLMERPTALQERVFNRLFEAAEIAQFSKENLYAYEVSVSAILSCRPFFILIFLPCIKMNHYGFSRKSIWKTWKHFLEVLKVDYNCSLADVCRDQHTTFGGMSSWMSRRGYSVKQAKADVVRDYYGGVEPSRPTTSSPSFTQIAPVMLSEEEFSLSGITITFNSGTTISVKRATPGGIIKMLCDYERKEGDPCIL